MQRACRRWSTVALGFSVCLIGSSGCADGPVDDASGHIAAQVQPVIGGEPAGACAWPSTVRVNGASSCTGTLIHPRIVTTAAHCVDGDGSTARITFGAARTGAGSFTLTGTCRAGARGQRGVNTRNDWAYCMLPDDERLDLVPVTRPLVGCEAERFLKPGARAWVVGFGDTRGTGGRSGEKNQVEVTVNQLDKLAPGTIDVGDATAGACHGDSGGPIYMQLRDGDADYGFRVFGSTSGPGTRFGCDCTCSTTYVNIANHVAAIEAREGIDVTPCTDDDGAWDPGPGCNDQLADPEHGTGTWPNCMVARTTEPIASCGPAFEPDAGMPDAGGMDPDGMAGSGSAGFGAAGEGAAGAGTAGVGTAGTGIAGSSATAGGGGVGAAPIAGAPGVAGAGMPPAAGTAAAPVDAQAGAAAPPGFGTGEMDPSSAGSIAPAPAPTAASSPSSGWGCSAARSGAPAPFGTLALLMMLLSRLAYRRRRHS